MAGLGALPPEERARAKRVRLAWGLLEDLVGRSRRMVVKGESEKAKRDLGLYLEAVKYVDASYQRVRSPLVSLEWEGVKTLT
jgi:hypothetical protein